MACGVSQRRKLKNESGVFTWLDFECNQADLITFFGKKLETPATFAYSSGGAINHR
jgi:hypothetical protein